MREAPFTIQDSLRCFCISRDPVIILTYGSPMAGGTMLAPYLAGQQVYFLAGSWWSYRERDLFQQTRIVYESMRDAFPEHQYIFLTNEAMENALLDHFEMPNYFCHHNAFIDESIFSPQRFVTKRFDAVYTARLSSFKRHELAKNISRWGLVFGLGANHSEEEIAYLRYIKSLMPGMTLMNGDPCNGTYSYMAPPQVAQAYNQARVGLCLSAVEGGNYSTTEYMLCGLPVVSTRSDGGREFFLDPEISRIVDDDPRAVADAVAEIISLRIPPQVVRLRALVKIRQLRKDFIILVQSLINQHNPRLQFEDIFSEIFINKLMTYPGTPQNFFKQHNISFIE